MLLSSVLCYSEWCLCIFNTIKYVQWGRLCVSVPLRGFVCACLRPMGCCYAAHLREAGLAAVVAVAVHRKVAVAAVEDTTVVVGRVAAAGEQTSSCCNCTWILT